jgi:hypothetical protein
MSESNFCPCPIRSQYVRTTPSWPVFVVVCWTYTNYNIVTCTVVRVTKITGSSSDVWIYWHFGYTLSLNHN